MTDPKMTGTKTCTKCLRDLPVIYFPMCANSKDGLFSWCRDCNASNTRAYNSLERQKR